MSRLALTLRRSARSAPGEASISLSTCGSSIRFSRARARTWSGLGLGLGLGCGGGAWYVGNIPSPITSGHSPPARTTRRLLTRTTHDAHCARTTHAHYPCTLLTHTMHAHYSRTTHADYSRTTHADYAPAAPGPPHTGHRTPRDARRARPPPCLWSRVE